MSMFSRLTGDRDRSSITTIATQLSFEDFPSKSVLQTPLEVISGHTGQSKRVITNNINNGSQQGNDTGLSDGNKPLVWKTTPRNDTNSPNSPSTGINSNNESPSNSNNIIPQQRDNYFDALSTNPTEMKSLPLQSQFMLAVYNGNIEKVDELLQNRYDVKVNIPLQTPGVTALVYAAERGNLPLVQLLIEKKALPTYVQNSTSLLYAASEGHLSVVQYLLQHGADIHSPYLVDMRTPLLEAVISNKMNIINLFMDIHHERVQYPLLNIPSPPYQNTQNTQNGPNNSQNGPNNSQNGPNQSFNYQLLSSSSSSIIASSSSSGAVLSYDNYVQFQLDPEYIDSDGRTLIHYAANSGNLNIIKKIVDFCIGRIHLDAIDIQGYTALHYSTQLRFRDISSFLLSLGANQKIIAKNGFSPLDIATVMKDHIMITLFGYGISAYSHYSNTYGVSSSSSSSTAGAGMTSSSSLVSATMGGGGSVDNGNNTQNQYQPNIIFNNNQQQQQQQQQPTPNGRHKRKQSLFGSLLSSVKSPTLSPSTPLVHTPTGSTNSKFNQFNGQNNGQNGISRKNSNSQQGQNGSEISFMDYTAETDTLRNFPTHGDDAKLGPQIEEFQRQMKLDQQKNRHHNNHHHHHDRYDEDCDEDSETYDDDCKDKRISIILNPSTGNRTGAAGTGIPCGSNEKKNNTKKIHTECENSSDCDGNKNRISNDLVIPINHDLLTTTDHESSTSRLTGGLYTIVKDSGSGSYAIENGGNESDNEEDPESRSGSQLRTNCYITNDSSSIQRITSNPSHRSPGTPQNINSSEVQNTFRNPLAAMKSNAEEKERQILHQQQHKKLTQHLNNLNNNSGDGFGGVGGVGGSSSSSSSTVQTSGIVIVTNRQSLKVNARTPSSASMHNQRSPSARQKFITGDISPGGQHPSRGDGGDANVDRGNNGFFRQNQQQYPTTRRGSQTYANPINFIDTSVSSLHSTHGNFLHHYEHSGSPSLSTHDPLVRTGPAPGPGIGGGVGMNHGPGGTGGTSIRALLFDSNTDKYANSQILSIKPQFDPNNRLPRVSSFSSTLSESFSRSHSNHQSIVSGQAPPHPNLLQQQQQQQEYMVPPPHPNLVQQMDQEQQMLISSTPSAASTTSRPALPPPILQYSSTPGVRPTRPGQRVRTASQNDKNDQINIELVPNPDHDHAAIPCLNIIQTIPLQRSISSTSCYENEGPPEINKTSQPQPVLQHHNSSVSSSSANSARYRTASRPARPRITATATNVVANDHGGIIAHEGDQTDDIIPRTSPNQSFFNRPVPVPSTQPEQDQQRKQLNTSTLPDSASSTTPNCNNHTNPLLPLHSLTPSSQSFTQSNPPPRPKRDASVAAALRTPQYISSPGITPVTTPVTSPPAQPQTQPSPHQPEPRPTRPGTAGGQLTGTGLTNHIPSTSSSSSSSSSLHLSQSSLSAEQSSLPRPRRPTIHAPPTAPALIIAEPKLDQLHE